MLSAALAVGAVSFVYYTPQKKLAVADRKPTTTAQTQQLEESLSKDTDGDGLKDWEEVLWRTDPKNPDSDRDGTRDNDEITAKRDPTKAGPDDALSDISALGIKSAADTSTSSMEENITQSIASRFGAAYFKQKLSTPGNQINPQQFTTAAFNEITNSIQTGISQAPQDHYAASDFAVSTNTSDQHIRAYINTLGAAIESTQFPNKNELEIVRNALTSDDFTGLGDLGQFSAGYKMLAEHMAGMKVPASMLDTHRAMANSFWRLSGIVHDMAQMQEDPIKGMVAINQYADEAARSVEPLKHIVQEIRNKNFQFAQGEGGSAFTKYLNI